MPDEEQRIPMAQCSGVARELYWDERSIEQKLEVLRQQALRQHRESEQIREDSRAVSDHSHDGFGRVMVPAETRGLNRIEKSYSRPYSLLTRAEAERDRW